jgi:hypothetical protein
MKRLPLHSGISVFKFQVHTNAIIAFLLLFDILVRQWGNRAKNYLVLVLNAKGGEIKGQSKWISQPLVNFENSRVRICSSSKILLLQNVVSYGENFDYGKKG